MQNAVNKIGEFQPDNLIGGNTHPQDVKAVNLVAGTGILKRGTLLNKFGVMCSSSDDVPVGILCDDVELDADNPIDTVMYISGDFRANEIIVGEGLSSFDFELELQKLGIFLK